MKANKSKNPCMELFNTLEKRFSSATDDAIFLCNKGDSIESIGSKLVVSRFDKPPVEVAAANWFDNIWLYLNISFRRVPQTKNIEFKPFVSICFFQGDQELRPLLRAEWDSYPPMGAYNHPQPHWHITNTEINEDSFEKLSENDVKEAAGDFAELKQPLHSSLDVYRMHLAMCGDWINTGNMISTDDSNEQITNWICSLLVHLRKEIEFVKDKM